MRLVLSDAEVLRQLDAASLLRTAFTLGDALVVSDVLYQRGIRSARFPDLIAMGLIVETLEGGAVTRAREIRRLHPGLSITDAFALVLAFPAGGRIVSACLFLSAHCRTRGWPCHDATWLLERIRTTTGNMPAPSQGLAS